MQTKGQAARKPDRRSLYTKRVIKDALLELLGAQHYEKISVAALCRQAEITRSTFYLHYDGMDNVLSELIDEALMVTEDRIRRVRLSERMAALTELIRTGTPDDLRRNEQLLSPCQRVADDPKYRALCLDPSLSAHVIHRIYRLERDEMISYMTQRCRVSRDQADKLFMMMVFGLFYVNRSMKWSKDDAWYEMQFVALRAILGMIDAL